MTEWFGVVLRLLLEILGVAALREPSALAFAAAVAVVALVALTLLVVIVPASAGGTAPHPLRAIDVSIQLSQSPPDAAGHSRPRAPGSAAPAA